MSAAALRAAGPLVALCAFALAKGTLWAAVVPIWQAPDEPFHFGYVEALAFQDGEHAVSRSHRSSRLLMDADRIMFHAEQAGVFAAGERARRERELDALPARSEPTEERRAYGSVYPPVYYALGALVARALESARYLDAVLATRLLSVVLSTIALALQYLALRFLLADGALALCAALVLTLMPMHTFMSSAVNPEVLVTLVLAAVLYVSARALRTSHDLRVTAVAGVLTGTGLLVKPSVLPAALIFALLVTLTWRAGRLRPASPIRHLALFAAIVAAIAGWWYAGSFAAPPIPADGRRDALADLALLLAEAWHLFAGYWGVFGWLDTPLPRIVFAAVAWVNVAALVGLAVFLARAVRRRAADPALALALGTVLAFVAFYAGIELVLRIGLQGRYLFPAAPAIVALQLVGLTGLLPEIGRRAVVAALLAPMAALHVLALFGTVVPRYYL